ncbi:MAG: hypothetical protein QOD62_296 [Actinomycetota bacterium]|jgi:hypothetical protein|nr:hypothetical protein [Actinomycetota bacterium]
MIMRCYGAMTPPKRAASSFGGRKASPGKNPPKRTNDHAKPAASSFIDALADLLRSRNIEIPAGLLEAPPEAYAGQSEAVVQAMARLKDEDLVERAGKVAGWGKRQAERAEQAWESSPLIVELRRRGLAEPARPTRVVGASFSLKIPLADWTDEELKEAVATWARLGSGGRI